MKEAHKHRLVGAAILAAVGVLFLPSFFKDRQDYAVDSASQIPARPSITAVEFSDPESPANIPVAPVPEDMFQSGESVSLPPPVADTATEPPPHQTTLPVSDQDLIEKSVPAVKNTSLSASAAGTANQMSQMSQAATSIAALPEKLSPPPQTAAGLVTGYGVRVASLSSRESAERLEARLLAMGHKAYVRTAQVSGANVYRVFAGPFIDQAEAAAAKSAIDKGLGVSSIVQKFEP